MKLTFKEKEDGLKNEIYYDDMLIGEVTLNIWNQKWKVDPFFAYSNMEQGILYMEYLSFYKAGKALAKLYADTFMLFQQDDLDDTQEINMRGVF